MLITPVELVAIHLAPPSYRVLADIRVVDQLEVTDAIITDSRIRKQVIVPTSGSALRNFETDERQP